MENTQLNFKRASQNLATASATCSRLEGITQAMESGLFKKEQIGEKFEMVNLRDIKRVLGMVYLELELHKVKCEYDHLFNLPEE